MFLFRLTLGTLLLGSSFAGYAQTTDPAAALRFYGGLGVYSSSHQDLGSWGNGARIPVQALVGYQLRPRLAVQLGVVYSGNRSTYDGQNGYYNNGIPVAYSVGSYSERSTTTSLLARYTLTRKLEHRFQADLLGGAKFEYSAYNDKGTYFDNRPATPSATPFDYTSTYKSALLSLGPSLRYRVVSRLDVVYDLTFDLPILGGNYSNSIYSPRPRLQATMALGLRYRFGRG
ncbi:hypothetical protein FNT36_17840 [Hymenobacter setariae]|uniref:Outer membrane protein OmpA-like transmembrane domain-containing protein n=1 Tax=Hymenobacter setariae TaxID=2594794 RepID=A0A558BSK2_9BACT|nr:hypothetical protein [Hymenobacter setariae]TVT39508.1 hypothetical protein FNT36_17840 [Hymenobacter setariae]